MFHNIGLLILVATGKLVPTLPLTLWDTCPLSLEQQSSTIDFGSKEAPFTTLIIFVGGIGILLATRRRELLVRGIPPLPGFVSKLLYICYFLQSTKWPKQSKISRCQRDDENFSLRVYHLFEGERVNPQRGNSLSPWQRDDENFFLTVLAGRPTDSRDLKCRGRVNPQRDISLSRWQRDEENFSLRVNPPLKFCSKLQIMRHDLAQ